MSGPLFLPLDPRMSLLFFVCASREAPTRFPWSFVVFFLSNYAYGVFFMIFFSSVDLFPSKSTFPKKIFKEYNHSVKQFGSRSGPTFCRS